MPNIGNYYLDLQKLNLLEKEDKNRIYELYRDMCYSFEEGRYKIAMCFFYTLLNSNYLIDIREQKIDTILDEGINN